MKKNQVSFHRQKLIRIKLFHALKATQQQFNDMQAPVHKETQQLIIDGRVVEWCRQKFVQLYMAHSFFFKNAAHALQIAKTVLNMFFIALQATTANLFLTYEILKLSGCARKTFLYPQIYSL